MRCQGKYEREAHAQGYRLVAGVDEVGRGALFGPVFAAAVILSPERPIRGLRDSKRLPAERRQTLAARIRERAICWAIGAADAFEIDHVNILQASRLAMGRAIEKLASTPDFLLIDAVKLDLPIPQRPLIHGDALSQCIAAASILAKVERDACMCEWDKVFPQYGLKNHKGYSTDEHWKALENYGPTALHRYSFWPVREHCPHSVWTGYPQQTELFPESEPAAGAPSSKLRKKASTTRTAGETACPTLDNQSFTSVGGAGIQPAELFPASSGPGESVPPEAAEHSVREFLKQDQDEAPAACR